MTTSKSINTTEKRDAVIISYYKYDHPYTDANCAWSTIYTVFYIGAAPSEGTVKVGTGWGQKFEDVAPNVNLVPLTDEIKQMYLAYKKQVAEQRVAKDMEKFKSALNEYNAAQPPQRKGQIVEVLSGKHKGKKGVISWFGHNKFGKRSGEAHWLLQAVNCLCKMKPYCIPAEGYDLILVRPKDGEKFYIDPSKCKVVEGFEPLTYTEDDVRRMHERYDNISSNLHMGTAYDYVNNVK